MSIEDALAKIAADNGLTTVSITRHGKANGEGYFGCTVHFDGYSSDGINCASGHHGSSIADAIVRALAEAKAKRTPQIGDIPTLTLVTA